MTLEEKIIELQSVTPPLTREEIIAEVEKFKASQPKVGVDKFAEESAKQEGVVEQMDATVTPEQTPDASESEDMVSQQETGSSVSPEEISEFSLFQDDPISKETKQGMLDFYNKAVNLSIERSQQPQAQIADEFTKVAKPGEVYKPGDGYEYKYEINDEGKGVYLTREEGAEDFTEATGTAALAIAGEFGHANFDKEAYFAQVKADEAQLRELNDLNNQVKESTPLTESVTVEQDFVSTADRWRNLERITKEKADIAQGEGVFDERKKSVTFKKADTKGELTRDKFETDEDFKAYKDWKKLEDITTPYTGDKGNYRPQMKNDVSRAEFEKAKKEGRRAVYTPTFGYSVQEKGTPTEEEWNKAMQEKQALEAKLDEGVDVETKMGFFGESKVISVSQIQPNPQAVNEFNSKYIAPTASANSENSGIDFSKLQDNKALFEKLQETIGLAVNDDPVIKKKYLELQLKAKPLINKKAAELQEKYDVNTPEGNAKYTKELQEYAKSLTQDKLVGSDEYKQRVNQISSVANAAFAAANNKYKRSEDTFLSTLDGIRGVYDNVPILDSVNEIAADFTEGFVKGSYQIGTGIDKAQMSYDASRVKAASEKIKGINDLISKGRITEDTLVNYMGKMIPAKEAKQKYELEKKDWRKALEDNLDEVIEAEGYTALFKAADLSDGISLSDVVLTTAEALPQIGLATAGTLAAAASGGTLAPAIFGALGTVTMFGTMYGDAYLEAARTGAIEDYEAENGEGTWANLSEKDQNLLLADGLEDGRYHNPGKAAVTAAVQTAMERFGAGKVLAKTQKALGVGKNGLASIIAGDIRQFGKNLVSGALSKAEAGLTEFATEYGQEIVGAVGKGLTVAGPGGANRYVDLGAAWEAGKAGGIVGIVMPFAGSIKSQATVEIRNLARNVAINFAPDSKFGSAAAANAKFFKEAQNELDKRLTSGNITKEQHLEESISIANIKNASDKIPTGTDTQTREKLIDLMVKRDQLQRTIESVGDKDLTEQEQQELNETKEELRDVMKQERLFRTSGNVKIAIEKSSRGDITFEDFNSADDMNAYARQQKLKGWNEKNSANHGVVLFDPKTKKEIILINNEISLEDGQVNVGAHEFLHTVLRNTVQNSKGTAIALGDSLTQYLEKIDAAQVDTDSDYGKRLAAYNEDPKAIRAEEKLTLFSDAIANGDVKFNESIFTKIGDSIRRTLQAAGLKSIKFNNGRDVYNFIKDYNKSIEKGKGLTKAQEALLEGRAEGELVKREYRTKDMLAAEQAMEGKLSKKLTPEQDKQSQNKVAEIKKLKQEGEAIAERFNKPFQPGAKQIKLENELRNDIKPVVDSFVENRTKALFDPIPADAKKGVSRKDFIQSMKSDIETMVINEFEGKQDLEKFIVNRGYLRANSLAERLGVKSVEEGISKGMEAAAKVAAEEVSVETKEKARKPGPRESRQYTPAFEEGLGIETEGKTTSEINEEINKQFDEAISKDLAKIGEVVSFGQTKNIGDAVGALMEKATGMPAKVFTDKTKNIAKKDVTSGAYTNVKQYLDKNAQRDFELLPDAFAPDTGKATFIPENVKKALYKKNDKGQFILDKSKTLKDYKELLGDIKSEKPVYRAAEAQTIKGLIALSIRNRMFEQAVPDAAARSTTGVKFSKRPVQTIDEVGKSKLAELSNLKNINQVTSALDIESVAVTNENRVERQKDIIASIEQHGLDINTFESASFANSGREYTKVNGVKFFQLVDGTKVKENSSAYNKAVKEGTFLPARGRLYYGVTDPAYKAAKEAAIANTPKNTPTAKRVTIKAGQKIDSDFISKNKDRSNTNMNVLDNVANQLAQAVENGMPIEVAATFISQGYQATKGLIKIAAPFKYVSEKFEYSKEGKVSDKTGEKFREEHNPPASVVGASLIWAIQNNAVAPVMKAIRDNYSQTQLSKSDDTKLDQAKLASTLPEGKSILDNPVSRMTKAGINLNTIIDPVTGKSLAEINNVGVSIKASKTNPNVVAEQNKLIDSQLNEEIDSKQAKARIKSYEVIAESKLEAGGFNVDTFGDKVNTDMTVEKQVESLETYDNAAKFSRRSDNPVKKIRVFDFDDTLARSKSMVIVNMPVTDVDLLDIAARRKFKKQFENLPSREQTFNNLTQEQQAEVLKEVPGATKKINATEFAAQAADLEAQGATFDFTEFSQVIDGKKGPLFNVAKTIAEKRGTEDLFILTARPANSATPIQSFMKAMGIDVPLKNITGLGDGTAAAKGRWIAGKVVEGYNDFYFADDATKNVQAVKEVLDQADVKSKVQIAKASKRVTFDKVFNDIIEAKTGIESYKQFSAAKAKTVGASKGKFTFFTTPSAEDFVGLLYKTLGKGKVGDAQMAFYKTNLIDPYNRAEMAISQAKVAAGRDYKELKKQFKNIPKTLEKETGIAKYTYQHAIRTYIWDSQGLEVPGLSKRDQKRLTDFIKADPDLQAFADQLVGIQKGKPYPKPDKDWTAGNITTDVISGINKVNRAEYLQEWQENVDIIFSEKNMNKLEAAFGAKYVEALKDSLRAMKSGSNRPLGGDRVSNAILDWLNNSVGAIMFLNTRSAVLQTISAVNFVNWGDNNILKAGKAFANQKQFWSDFLTLMNSDYLLERRDGLKINVSESEIADAVEGSKNKVNAAISYLLNKGFVFTRYADSFAIASGGATFYRNRIESLVEQGMDRKSAEQQAFEDFRLIAEENQQSSSPMRISQQQRSLIGRIILQFGNTQLQYVRIQKRAVQDLVNGRGDWRANISKIVYYGAIQNIMFNALQSGLAWALFDDDEDDEELTEKNKEQKLERALNGAIDSQLKGLGIQGAVVAGVKNALLTIAEQADKKSPKFEEALDDLLSIAPALGSKIRKLKSAARTVSWNRKEIKEKGFSLDNPAYLAGAQTISAVFNIPLDRAVMKMNNMRNILNPATENWQKVALALGWSGWDVGLPYFGLAEDKPVLTETEKQTQKLFNLNKSDQVKMLLDLGLTKKEIRALTKEDQRVDQIIKLQNKKKDAGSKK